MVSRRTLFIAKVVGLAALSSALLGYDIGATSGAKLQIRDHFNLTDTQTELMVGSLNIVSGFGGLASGKLSDAIGRKGTIAVSCVVSLAGSLTMALAPTFVILIVGRVVDGLAVGAGLLVGPLYTAELSPMALRGGMVSFSEVAINVGLLLGYVAGWAFSSLPDSTGWRYMLGVGAGPPVVILAGLLVMPESPRWLVSQGRSGEAQHVLENIEAPKAARAAVETLEAECEFLARHPFHVRDLLCPARGLRRLLVAGLGVAFFQQATGIEAAVYYTPEVFEEAGITDEREQLVATIGVGLVKLVFIIVAVLTLDRVGRRPMLVVSGLGMLLAQATIGLNFQFWSSDATAIFGQCLFMAAFSVGYGPVAWVLAAEIFPLRARGLAFGVATLVNRLTSGTIALTFLSLQDAITPQGTFFLFAGVSLLAALFPPLFVVETKGKGLEEIEASLDQTTPLLLDSARDPGSSSSSSSGGGRSKLGWTPSDTEV